MADDPVEAARRKYSSMLRRSSYFPAANLRQFEGTELAPPGAGTYYNPSRYIGASYGNQRRAQREMAGAWQSDLAFNVMHNPRQAQALEAERIGAQYGGGASWAGRPGQTTITLPSGGTTVVSDAVAKRLSAGAGYGAQSTGATPESATMQGVESALPTLSSLAQSRVNYQTPPSLTGTPEFLAAPASNAVADPQYRNIFGERAGNIGRAIGSGFNWIGRQFVPSYLRQPQASNLGLGGNRFASERGDLMGDIEGTFYGGGHAQPSPTPTPIQSPRYGLPTRYFDNPYA